MCEAFHGPRPAGFQCAHLNGDPRDNRPENLIWATPSENNLHKREHGTASKIRKSDAIDIFLRRKAGEAAKPIAEHYGLHVETVYKIGNRVQWAHATADL